MSSTSRRA
jgi:phytanoyl-CoA hydroxylase